MALRGIEFITDKRFSSNRKQKQDASVLEQRQSVGMVVVIMEMMPQAYLVQEWEANQFQAVLKIVNLVTDV